MKDWTVWIMLFAFGILVYFGQMYYKNVYTVRPETSKDSNVSENKEVNSEKKVASESTYSHPSGMSKEEVVKMRCFRILNQDLKYLYADNYQRNQNGINNIRSIFSEAWTFLRSNEDDTFAKDCKSELLKTLPKIQKKVFSDFRKNLVSETNYKLRFDRIKVTLKGRSFHVSGYFLREEDENMFYDKIGNLLSDCRFDKLIIENTYTGYTRKWDMSKESDVFPIY